MAREVVGREGVGLGRQVCAPSRACWSEGFPRIALRLPDLPWPDGSAVHSGVRGRKQVAKCGATAPRGNPERGPSEGPARRLRREPASTWRRRAAAARQTQRSASELRISRKRDPPGAG